MALTTETTVDNFVQEVWSKITRDKRQKNLILGNLVSHDFEREFAGTPTDTIRVNGVDNFGTASAFSAGDDPITFEAGQFLTQQAIDINRHYYKAFAMQHDANLLSNIPLQEKLTSKAAYAVSLELDTFIAGLFDTATPAVGTLGTSLNDDDIIEITKTLDAADVPQDGRVFVFSVEQDAEFKKEDKYINADYARAVGQFSTGGRPTNGLVADLYNMGWYVSNNLESSGSGHDNAAFTPDAIDLVVIDNMRFEGPANDLESDSVEVAVHQYYGCELNAAQRSDHIVWAKGK